jgi:pimeloyl-ACP methyl ester carboxylesterase
MGPLHGSEVQDFLAAVVLSEGIYKAVDKGARWAEEEMERVLARFPPNAVSLSLHDIQLARRGVDHRYLLAHGPGVMYLVCMGTKELRDFMVDVSLRRAPWKTTFPSSTNPKDSEEVSLWLQPAVHGGFLKRSVNIPIESLFLHARRRSLRFVICGHSLGGAVAILCTLRLLSLLSSTSPDKSGDLSRVLKCICFGTPALGNRALRKHVAAMGWTSVITCYALSADPVPRVLLRPSDWQALVSMQKDVSDIANVADQPPPPATSIKRRSPLRALPRFRHIGRFVLMDKGTSNLPGWRVAHRMFSYRAAAEEMVRGHASPSSPSSSSHATPPDTRTGDSKAAAYDVDWPPKVTSTLASAHHPLFVNVPKTSALKVAVQGTGLDFVTGAELELAGQEIRFTGKVISDLNRRRLLEALASENLINFPNRAPFSRSSKPKLMERLLSILPPRFRMRFGILKDGTERNTFMPPVKAEGNLFELIHVEFPDVPVNAFVDLTISCLTDFSKTTPCAVQLHFKTCWIVPLNEGVELRRLVDGSFNFQNGQISNSLKKRGILAVLVNMPLSQTKRTLGDRLITLRDMIRFAHVDDGEGREKSYTPFNALTSLRNFPKREARRLAEGLPVPEAIMFVADIDTISTLSVTTLEGIKKEASSRLVVMCVGVYIKFGSNVDATSIVSLRRKLSASLNLDERLIILLVGQEEMDQQAIVGAFMADVDPPSSFPRARL